MAVKLAVLCVYNEIIGAGRGLDLSMVKEKWRSAMKRLRDTIMQRASVYSNPVFYYTHVSLPTVQGFQQFTANQLAAFKHSLRVQGAAVYWGDRLRAAYDTGLYDSRVESARLDRMDRGIELFGARFRELTFLTDVLGCLAGRSNACYKIEHSITTAPVRVEAALYPPGVSWGDFRGPVVEGDLFNRPSFNASVNYGNVLAASAAALYLAGLATRGEYLAYLHEINRSIWEGVKPKPQYSDVWIGFIAVDSGYAPCDLTSGNKYLSALAVCLATQGDVCLIRSEGGVATGADALGS